MIVSFNFEHFRKKKNMYIVNDQMPGLLQCSLRHVRSHGTTPNECDEVQSAVLQTRNISLTPG